MPGAPVERPGQADPYAVFRPRRGRRVAQALSMLSVVVFSGVALSVPWADPQIGGQTAVDQILLVLFGLAMAAALWRFASIRATPSPGGLVVRNLITTRSLSWPEVVRVQFGSGAPWVSVDLDDTDCVAVMAIQRADGDIGRAEAARLSALVLVHSRPGPGI